VSAFPAMSASWRISSSAPSPMRRAIDQEPHDIHIAALRPAGPRDQDPLATQTNFAGGLPGQYERHRDTQALEETRWKQTAGGKRWALTFRSLPLTG